LFLKSSIYKKVPPDIVIKHAKRNDL